MTFCQTCTIVRLHMKKSLLRWMAAVGTALVLSVMTVFPASAEEKGIGPGYEDVIEETDGRPSDPMEMALLKKAAEASSSETKAADADGLPASETEKQPEAPEKTATAGASYGTFKISGYCNCSRCSGGNNYTYSGTVPKANHTLSADLDKFPLGTKLYIDGVVYIVEDMGGGVLGDRLDIFFDTHEEALDYGVKEVEVFAVIE